MKFEPLYDRILVQRIEASKKFGSIHLPEAALEKPQEGIVVSVGGGHLMDGGLMQLAVREGDLVLFGKYSGTDIIINDKEHLILREDEVLGIFRNEKKEDENE